MSSSDDIPRAYIDLWMVNPVDPNIPREWRGQILESFRKWILNKMLLLTYTDIKESKGAILRTTIKYLESKGFAEHCKAINYEPDQVREHLRSLYHLRKDVK